MSLYLCNTASIPPEILIPTVHTYSIHASLSAFATTHSLLLPVIADDPLLQYYFGDDAWSDDDEELSLIHI